jgi:hypothetical protein
VDYQPELLTELLFSVEGLQGQQCDGGHSQLLLEILSVFLRQQFGDSGDLKKIQRNVGDNNYDS